jgi:hypothetical protein
MPLYLQLIIPVVFTLQNHELATSSLRPIIGALFSIFLEWEWVGGRGGYV